MKILGVYNNKYFIASLSHHDYVVKDDLMHDGGSTKYEYIRWV